MCPERQLLSVYLDGELPSPWKERMEAHLVSCSECAALLRRFKECRDMLKTPPADVDGGVKERVWQNLSAHLAQERESEQQPAANRLLWRRTIMLPAPAVAAAAVVFIVTVVFAVIRPFAPAEQRQTPVMASSYIPTDFDAKSMVSDQDIGRIFHYLEQEDTSDYMIIKLPESRMFTRIGEPEIIRVMDYPEGSRRK
ncbi:MAG: zf-HC2 domain-containing protein [Treponema sp.]|jgi:anti-sigma factor RsiW|nr:zf-HC2 domain-containing protein [Treponema sp.]